MCEAAHAFHVELARKNEERHHQHHDDGQRAIHEEEEEEGAEELQEGGNEKRNALSGEVDHVAHVLLQAVGQIARVKAAQRLPPAAQQAAEDVALHGVERLDAQNGPYPPHAEAQHEAQRHDECQQGKGTWQGGECRLVRGNVDCGLGGPHHGQIK